MSQATTPLAIVGMACLFPKADGLNAYWANVKRGVDGIGDVPATHWNPADYYAADPKAPDMTYAKRGGFIDAVPFDPAAHGIAPNLLEATDASQLLGLVVATEALKNAGYGAGRAFDRDRASVVLGVTGTLQLAIPLGARLGHPHWRKALSDCGIDPQTAEAVMARIGDAYVPWQENSFPGLLGNVVAGRIANRLDLGGTNCVVDAACASSLSAMHLAALELAAGRVDMVVTGGVDAFNDIFMYMCFSKTPALSPTGDSRPFDQGADGTILGEGLGMVVLKRLDDAERDGDHIWAVLKAIGSSSDGRGKAIYAPSDAGQVKALRNAYELAGITPDTVELVEAHGTGTKVGDATEMAGLMEVYGGSERANWCAIGSVKSMIGHTKAAAGAAGLIKAALALHHKVLPPTIKVENPVDMVGEGKSAFYLNTQPRPWLANPKHPRRAAVSAFGFGGSNFHAVLEEHQGVKAAPDWDGRTELVALGASSRAELEASLEALLALDWDGVRLAAEASRAAFSPAMAHRLLLVIEKGVDLTRLVANATAQLREGRASWSTPDGAYYGEGPAAGKLALLFPGQGAQYPGMGRDLACLFPEALDALQQADAAFAWAHGSRLVDKMIPMAAFSDADRERQADRLRATDVAQPALGAAGMGAWRVLKGFGVKPDALAGHSYGELVALCVAGRLTETELAALSILRGRLMAGNGGDRGGMLAVRGDVATLERLVSERRLNVVLANKNAPKQVVLSGATAAIEAAQADCAAAGLHVTRLQVGAAFHSPLVADAATGLAEGLAGVAMPAGRVPVYANTTAATYPEEPYAARQLLAEQLARPVEFVKQIEAMARDGVTTFLELAPGARLTGLVRSILEGTSHTAVALDASNGKRDGVADLARALAQLAALGHLVDLSPWQGGSEGVRALKERVKPRMSVPISGVNHRSSRAALPPVPAKPAPAPAAVPASTNGKNGTHPPLALEAAPNGKVVSMPAEPPAQSAPSHDPGLVVEALRASQESLVALQRLQEQTAKLHTQYLSGQESAQQSFMNLLERQQALFSRVLGLDGGALPAHAMPALVAPAAAAYTAPLAASLAPAAAPVAHVPVAAPVTAPMAQMPPAHVAAAAPVASAPVPAPVVPAPVVPAPMAAPAVVAQAPASAPVMPAPQAAPAGGHRAAVEAALLAVVAEKTGYPIEMLGLEMALEADLGIDSIKRVEILSGVQEALPDAPRVAPEQMGTLVTLGDVLAHLAAGMAAPVCAAPMAAASVAVPAPVAPVPSAPVAAAPTGGNRAEVETALLAVVADKTGYPVEMLGLEMALEADLGIDSIKRVEILSGVQEALPNAPRVAPEQMGTLVTLGDVLTHLAAGVAAPVAAAPAPAIAPTPVATPAAPANSNARVEAAVIATIADKTGYPPEMLGLEMALEADLGIDSIKRVEILSALQEALPGSPTVKPEHMGTLSTLGQLVTYLSGSGDASAPAAPAAPQTSGPAPTPAAQAPAPATPAMAPAAPVPAPIAQAPTVPAAETPAPTWEPIAGLQRLILRAVPLPASPERESGKVPFGADICVADEGTPLGQALRDRLQALGFKVRAAQVTDDATWPQDGVAGLFIVAPGADARGGVWAPESEQFLKQSLRLTQRLAPQLLASAQRGGAALVTVSRLDGAFGVIDLDPAADATGGGLAGLAKTAGLEWPDIACQAVDVDRDWIDAHAIAAELVRELYLDGPSEVGLRPDARMALDLDETPIVAPSQGLPFGPGDLVVVTGGARGVTAETAVALARYARPTLALLGRSPAPTAEPAWLAACEAEADAKAAILANAKEQGQSLTPRDLETRFRDAMANREVLRTLARIDAEGAKAVYVSLDVRDGQAVAAAIDGLRAQHGPVRGLIHGAGVLADRRIADLTPEQVDGVLDTKLAGLRHLLAAVGDEPRTIALFSSVTARRGRVGQVAYAIANEALDKVAQQLARRHPDRRVVAINWGPWDGGMVTPALKRMFAEEGVAVVPLDAGAEFLAQELAQPAGAAVEVLVLGATSAPTPEPTRPVRLQTAFSRWLTPKQYPFLASHVMNGKAVLPVAMMVEWLAHGALHANPGLQFHGLRDLRVFRGVVLDDAPYGVRVAASSARRADGLHEVTVELRGTGENDALHARCTVLLASSLPGAPADGVALPAAGDYARSAEAAYQDVLFHGPDFQGILAVERCSRDGIVADTMLAPSPERWIQAPLREGWLADPLALDVAFQLLILWSVEQLQAPCLPSYVAEYRQFRAGFPEDGVRVVARVAERRGSQLIADVAFLDRSGSLVALMRGAEATVDAGLAEAFKRNALTPSMQP